MRGEDGQQAGQVRAVPVARHIGLAESDQAARPEPGEEGARIADHHERRAGRPAPSRRPPGSPTRMGSDATAAPNSRRAISARGAEPRATATSGHRIGSIIHPVSCVVLITGPPRITGPPLAAARRSRRRPQPSRVQLDPLPPDPRRHRDGGAGMPHGGAQQRSPGGGHGGAADGGEESVPVRAVQGDAERQPLVRARHAHLVPAVDRVVRRDVELLVDPRPALVVGPQQVGVPLVVGVVHLRDHAGQRAVRPVAPEQGQRVERVAEHPGVREHQHLAAAEVDAAAAQELVDVGPDAAGRVAEVIARSGIRPAATASPGRGSLSTSTSHS